MSERVAAEASGYLITRQIISDIKREDKATRQTKVMKGEKITRGLERGTYNEPGR